MNLLYVEDEKHLALAVAQVLKKNNYAIDLAYDGETGLNYALAGSYDVIILDIMLPKLSGIQVLQEMRKAQIDTPVILLTAKAETQDKVSGLDSGADDYLAKPFQMEELMARIRALGRRRGQLTYGDVLVCGDIELDINTLNLYANGKSFHLTPKESKLLELLMHNKEHTVPTSNLIEKVWGWDSDAEDRHVHVQISFLRKKLGILSEAVKIKTVYGVGYMLTIDVEGVSDV